MPKKENPLKNYAVFSGLAFQIFACIFGLGYLGSYLDKKYTQSQYLTAIGVLAGVALSMYITLTLLKRINSDE